MAKASSVISTRDKATFWLHNIPLAVKHLKIFSGIKAKPGYESTSKNG